MSQHTPSKVQRLWVWGPETEAGTAQMQGQGQQQRGRGCWRHLRGLHPSAVANVVVAVAVEAAFVASFMHLNNLKPQDEPSTKAAWGGGSIGWGLRLGLGRCVVPGAGNANYVMCQVTGKFILIAVEMQYCIYTHTHTCSCPDSRGRGMAHLSAYGRLEVLINC